MTRAKTNVKIQLFVVLSWIKAKLVCHIVDALLVHIVVERLAGMLLDTTSHIDAVGAYGSTDCLYRGIGIAPSLQLVHHLTDAGPEIVRLLLVNAGNI